MEGEQLDARLEIASLGGKHAQTKAIVEFIMEQAGRAFAAHDDASATTLREMGHKLRQWENEASLELSRMNRLYKEHFS